MTAPINRPDEWRTLGDHEQRVRDLEAICCGGTNSGFDAAQEIANRAFSWYGCGDGETNTSSVRNYGSGGDGTFVPEPVATQSGDTTPAGTIGPSCGWALCRDDGSYQGGQKRYAAPGGYEKTPYITIPDTLDGVTPFSVNLWAMYYGNSIFYTDCPVPGSFGAVAGKSGGFGQHAGGASDAGMYLIGDNWTSDCAGRLVDYYVSVAIYNGVSSASETIWTIPPGNPTPATPWAMISITWDPATSEWSVYKNGGLLGTHIITGTFPNLNDLNIGVLDLSSLFTNSYGTWYGYIDEVGLWAECLTGGDIALLYFAGDAPPLVPASGIDSGNALCGEPLVADGNGGATWGNSCALDSPFALPAVGVVTAQDVVDALVAMGLVTQGT